MVDNVPAYPGLGVTRPSLFVQERMGPTILIDMLASGRDLESHVRSVMGMWKHSSKNFSPAAHSEAVCLARCLHIFILEMGCARVALRTSKLPEIMLRRLFCVLEVERQVASSNVPRARAWQTVETVLEHQPDAYATGATMAKFVADRFNAISKFETNVAKNPAGAKN